MTSKVISQLQIEDPYSKELLELEPTAWPATGLGPSVNSQILFQALLTRSIQKVIVKDNITINRASLQTLCCTCHCRIFKFVHCTEEESNQ